VAAEPDLIIYVAHFLVTLFVAHYFLAILLFVVPPLAVGVIYGQAL
jgi:hypothetical protein